MSGDKSSLNGTDPAENGVNGSEDTEMREESQNSKKTSKSNKDKDGDDEMTVVVPPAKGSSTPSAPDKATEADLTNGAVDGDTVKEGETLVDPQEKAISGKMLKKTSITASMLTSRQKSKPTCPCWSVPSVSLILGSA
jgi:26S proteasome regulatory subunit N3